MPCIILQLKFAFSAVSFKLYFIQNCSHKKLHSFLAFFTMSQGKRHHKVCKSSNMHSWLYPACTKIDTCFWPIFTDLQNKFLVQSLISKPNINQIKHFRDQNLSWLIVNRKQFQFMKSNILFSCYAPLNSESFLTQLV